MRDDFPKPIITEIAKGVGYCCSNPECSRQTVGANAEQDGIITIGVAAHICAASPGGPRYDPDQDRDARRSRDNGIWLCQNCGRLIDADPQNFTVEILRKWKIDAQSRAFRALVASHPPNPSAEAARMAATIAADDASASDAAFEAVHAKAHTAASTDLAAFKQTAIWSDGAVDLTLRLYEDANTPPFSIRSLPLAVEIAPEVTIISAPGTGKTTTLLQLAEHALAANSLIPVYFRLADWAVGTAGLLESVLQRAAFKNLTRDEFGQIAGQGRVLLLLDGWNEIADSVQRRLRVELTDIRRELPSVRVVLTTRRQMLDVPLSGPRVEIEGLSEDQQTAMAQAQLGQMAEKVFDAARRTPGVRDLISIPLYLSTLLSIGSQGENPTTKEALLRLFIRQHEQSRGRTEALRAILYGCHTEVLTALASEMNASGVPALADADARRIIAVKIAELRGKGQFTAQPEPSAILEVFASHHTLIISGGDKPTISFQHQQFQEWYASHDVGELMLLSFAGDNGARVKLRAGILDRPAWEESILFAVERLSHEAASVGAVAHAVNLARAIDPMLAAEMIFRSSPEVWELVKAETISFVQRWHTPNTVDRAVRFMIITGRAEFEPQIWPLASSADAQLQLPTLRQAPRFRASILGADLDRKIAALAEPIRKNLLAMMAAECGPEELDLVTEIAKADPSPAVQSEVVQYFQFRRADRNIAVLLEGALDGTWTLLAGRGYFEEIRAPAAIERLKAEREKIRARATDPIARLRLLLDQQTIEPDRTEDISAAIADPQYPALDQHADTAFYHAYERAPAAALEGLRRRVQAGLELPFRASDFLTQLEIIDEDPVSAALLDVDSERREVNALAAVAGPRIVDALVDRYLACSEALRATPGDRGNSEKYHRLRDRLQCTRPALFIAAILARADIVEPHLISSLATAVFLHGVEFRKEKLQVDPALRPKVIDMLRRWVETVISSPDGRRYDLNEVSNAIGRVGSKELLPELKRLIDEEFVRLQQAKDNAAEARKRGSVHANSDAAMRYSNQYRQALISIGGDEAAAVAAGYLEDLEFGLEAAHVLRGIADEQTGTPQPDFRRQWPWFEMVEDARNARATAPWSVPANTLSDAIFAAVDRLAQMDETREKQLLAIHLAKVAMTMPHRDQTPLVERLLALPQPPKAKLGLLQAMVMDGYVLDEQIVMQGIDDWLDGPEQSAWHRRQETWEIEPWLELLPYTSRPDAVIDGLTKIKAFYGAGHQKRWERVLVAVANVPGLPGDALLVSLARAHKDIAGEYEWMKATLGRKSASAVLMYVDLFAEGVFSRDRYGHDVSYVAREIAPYVKKFPELRSELKTRYDAVGEGLARSLFESLFAEIGEDQDLVAMVKKYAAGGKAYDGQMSGVVHAITVRREPVSDGSNSFYIRPKPIGPIRKILFDLRENPREADLASMCLKEMDSLRDEYGIATNDTRHPDVLSGIAWPTEAGT